MSTASFIFAVVLSVTCAQEPPVFLPEHSEFGDELTASAPFPDETPIILQDLQPEVETHFTPPEPKTPPLAVKSEARRPLKNESRPLVLADASRVHEQQFADEDQCSKVKRTFDQSQANLSNSTPQFAEHFQLQAVTSKPNKTCDKSEMIRVDCYWTMQECMLAAWSRGRRTFVYGVNNGECWIMRVGDQCKGGFKTDNSFHLIGMLNSTSVTQDRHLDMGLLAAGVRPFAIPDVISTKQWVTEAVVGFRSWWDATALYSTSNRCVLGFGGTESTIEIEKVVKKLESSKYIDECGFQLNEFIVSETKKRFEDSVFQDFFVPVLQNRTKCKEITVVGQGLGGAVAHTMAACMNNGYTWKSGEGFVKGVPNFVVNTVNTMGAPRIGKGAITNGNTSDNKNCFSGTRIYNQDDALVQFAKSSASHPRMDALELSESGENYMRVYTRSNYSCGNNTVESQLGAKFESSLAAQYLFRMAWTMFY